MILPTTNKRSLAEIIAEKKATREAKQFPIHTLLGYESSKNLIEGEYIVIKDLSMLPSATERAPASEVTTMQASPLSLISPIPISDEEKQKAKELLAEIDFIKGQVEAVGEMIVCCVCVWIFMALGFQKRKAVMKSAKLSAPKIRTIRSNARKRFSGSDQLGPWLLLLMLGPIPDRNESFILFHS